MHLFARKSVRLFAGGLIAVALTAASLKADVVGR